LGLGSVFIGSALANVRVIEVLKLPRGVMSISLLCIDYPREEQPVRPRIPLEAVLFADSWRRLSREELRSAVKLMNEKLEEG